MSVRAAVSASVISLLAGMAAPAVVRAADFAGTPAGAQATVFHPLNDLRRPVSVTLRAPGAQTGRSFRIAPAGTGDLQVVGNARGDAVAWWSEGEDLMVAVRDRGDRTFGPARNFGPGPFRPNVVSNARGDALLTAYTSNGRRSWWRPAGGSFGKPRPVPGEFGEAGLSDDGEALYVDREATWSTSKRGGRWTKARPLFRARISDDPITAFSPDGGAMVLALDDLNEVWVAAERRDGAFRRTDAPALPDLWDGEVEDMKLSLGDSGAAAVVYESAPRSRLMAARRPAGGRWSRPTVIGSPLTGAPQVAVASDGSTAIAGWTTRGIVTAYSARGEKFVIDRATSLPQPRSRFQRQSTDVGLVAGPGGATVSWQERTGGRIESIVRDFNQRGAGKRTVIAWVPFARIGPPSACTPPGSVTVASNRRARIYTVTTPEGGTQTYACMYSRGAPVGLGVSSVPPRLAGTWVASLHSEEVAEECLEDCGPEDEDHWIRADNLADDVTVDTFVGTRAGGRQPISGLVVSRRGGVAWMSCGSAGCRVLRRAAGAAAATEIAAGAAIDPQSLQLTGTELSWVDAGERRVETLR